MNFVSLIIWMNKDAYCHWHYQVFRVMFEYIYLHVFDFDFNFLCLLILSLISIFFNIREKDCFVHPSSSTGRWRQHLWIYREGNKLQPVWRNLCGMYWKWSTSQGNCEVSEIEASGNYLQLFSMALLWEAESDRNWGCILLDSHYDCAYVIYVIQISFLGCNFIWTVSLEPNSVKCL